MMRISLRTLVITAPVLVATVCFLAIYIPELLWGLICISPCLVATFSCLLWSWREWEDGAILLMTILALAAITGAVALLFAL